MNRLLSICVGVLATLAAGCGGDSTRATGQPQTGANLKGTVKYAGAVVGGGTVGVYAKGDRSRSARGSIDASGTYAVKDAPIGEVVITVETETAKMFDPAVAGGGPPGQGGQGGGNAPNMKYVRIPATYNSPDTSKLTHTVTAGEQTHDLILK